MDHEDVARRCNQQYVSSTVQKSDMFCHTHEAMVNGPPVRVDNRETNKILAQHYWTQMSHPDNARLDALLTNLLRIEKLNYVIMNLFELKWLIALMCLAAVQHIPPNYK